MNGKMSKPQAIILCMFTWFWALPFTVMPMIRVWGRYIPEGYLTTCSFDYLTDDADTRVFSGAIFIWAYLIPMFLICYFYFKLFGHVSVYFL